jgi:hypothetical protein
MASGAVLNRADIDSLYGESRELQWTGIEGRHPIAAERSGLPLPQGRYASIAVVDWSALNNTWQILREPAAVTDPFIAILDLSTIITAVIFYDHLLVLDYGEVAQRTTEILGLDNDVIVGLPPGLPDDPIRAPTDEAFDIRSMIEWLYNAANLELRQAVQYRAPWILDLQRRWEALLPGLHSQSFRKELLDTYKYVSYERDPTEHGGHPAIDFDSLFSLHDDAWRVDDGREELTWRIVDNDLRSLFYEILLGQLRQHLDVQRTFTFRYLANALRSPMQFARARYAEHQLAGLSPAPEDWMQQEWKQLYRQLSLDVRLPFWLAAVLQTARRGRTIPNAVVELRAAARTFRKHRVDLETSCSKVI